VQGIFYASVFQDVIRFGIIGEDVTACLSKTIENYTWGELEAWLDAHHDLLIQRHEVIEAPSSRVGSTTSIVRSEVLLSGDKASSSGSLSNLGYKQGLRTRK